MFNTPNSDPGDEQPGQALPEVPSLGLDAIAPSEWDRVQAEQEADLALNDLSDLDALLANSMALQLDRELEKAQAEVEGKQAAAARKRLASQDSGGLSGAERDRLRETILLWETRYEWNAEQLICVESLDICACGSFSPHFIGLYQLQSLKAKASTRRLVACQQGPDNLTKTYHTLERTVPFCPACRETKGFALRYMGDLKL